MHDPPSAAQHRRRRSSRWSRRPAARSDRPASPRPRARAARRSSTRHDTQLAAELLAARASASASSVTPGDRILAGGVDVGQHHHIGARERAAELVHQKLRAREAMRLKRDDQTPLRNRPGRGDRPRQSRSGDVRSLRRRRHRSLRRAAETGARRRETRRAPRAISLHAMPSSRDIATAASAFSTLWRPGTDSCSCPSSTARPPGLRAANGAHRSESLQLHVGRGDVGGLVEAVGHDVTLDVAVASTRRCGSSAHRITAPFAGTPLANCTKAAFRSSKSR